MSDQKPNQFQYQSINANQTQNPMQSPHPNDYPITPPPYTPYPDQNCKYLDEKQILCELIECL